MMVRKLAVSLADSTDLRIILTVLCTIVEVLRCSQDDDSEEMKHTQQEFKNEIGKLYKSKL